MTILGVSTKDIAWRVAVLAFVPVVAFYALAVVAITPASAAGENENKIVFVEWDRTVPGTLPQIAVMNSDGTDRNTLTTVGGNQYPTWSPDKSKVAFTSSRDGNAEIYVVNTDGTGETRLTNTPTVGETRLSWSPDGTKIAYDGGAGIYYVNASDGTGATFVTAANGAFSPQWSPDGTAIAYFRHKTISGVQQHQIVKFELATSTETVLMELSGGPVSMGFTGPQWSPDGTKLVHAINLSPALPEVYIIDANGVDPAVKVPNTVGSNNPSWSPDGSQIVFNNASNVSITEDLFIINPDGSGKINLTNTSGIREWGPVWRSAGNVTITPTDETAPVININSPVNGSTVELGANIAADYYCEDEQGGSGVATCEGTVASGASIDTSSVGEKSFTVNATDNAGNDASLTFNYTVVYQNSGFLAPIDSSVINTAKAGRTIPVKFRLTDASGIPISDPSSFENITSRGTACDASEPTEEVEQYTGSSGLQYLGDGVWQYNWKTPKSYAGQCRVMSLNLSDGTSVTASFQL